MQAFSLRHWLVRAAICGACAYHMCAMLAANMPTNSAFGHELRAPFALYLARAGLWQNWVMFHTIPYFRAVRPTLVAHLEDGRSEDHGAILPGLTRYRHNTRLSTLFLRLTFPTDDTLGFAQGYLRKACDAVERETGVRPRAMGLRLDSLRLKPLAEVRSSGKIGKESHDASSASVPCE